MKKSYRNIRSKGVQYAYLLDCMYSDDVDMETMSDSEKLKFSFERFKEEKYSGNLYYICRDCTDWLQGMCMCAIEWRNFQIEQILKNEWGWKGNTNQVNSWFVRNAVNLVQMWRREGLV